jgi:hypothetical protein
MRIASGRLKAKVELGEGSSRLHSRFSPRGPPLQNPLAIRHTQVMMQNRPGRRTRRRNTGRRWDQAFLERYGNLIHFF